MKKVIHTSWRFYKRQRRAIKKLNKHKMYKDCSESELARRAMDLGTERLNSFINPKLK